jgi:2,4-dienoyl-CoA reductase-like NADH-dependent reductase (Old Yellow Enzyme family)
MTADPIATTPLLFTPLTLRSVTTRNRIVVSPMCQYRSVDGGPVDWHLVYWGRFAIGGAGIVFSEETAVEPRGRKTHDCAGLYDDAHVRDYRRINDFITAMGAIPAIQLGHAGRRGSTHGALQGWKPLTAADAADGLPPWPAIAPSPMGETPASPIPTAMDRDDIRAQIETWRVAALRAADAGFKICEIHGAHGYLIHQFLSPQSNTRNDGYGGTLDGRMRFALELTEAMRAAWPQDLPLFFRVSAVEGRGGVWGMPDTTALTRALVDRGVDVIDCSAGGIGGTNGLAELPRVPGMQAGFSSQLRRDVGIPTMAVGMITDALHAEALLQEGHADLIALARAFMDDPNWPLHAAERLGLPGALEVVPLSDSARLRQREAHRQAFPPGRPVSIPFSIDEQRPYSWEKGRPLLPQSD